MAELAAAGCPGSDGLFRPGEVYCVQEVGHITAYLEPVAVLNFLVNFFLLLGTNRLSGHSPAPKRIAAAAAVGAVCTGACLLWGNRFPASAFWRWCSLMAMGLIAFGWNRSSIKRMGIFLLLSMALGGLAVSFGRGVWTSVLLSAAGIWLLCHAAFGDAGMERELIPLELAYGGNTVHLIALRDTGNTLRDPITGEGVLVISAEAATRLTGLTGNQLRQPLETLESRPLPGLRLIPYRAVGTAGGFLLGLRFENARLDGKQRTLVAAFAPEGLGREEGFQALAGGML